MEQKDSVKTWVMFCFNYPDIRNVIKWMCERRGCIYLESHLNEKFAACYEQGRSSGAMNLFYCALDEGWKDALLAYCFEVYKK